jgi:hypothetical protein
MRFPDFEAKYFCFADFGIGEIAALAAASTAAEAGAATAGTIAVTAAAEAGVGAAAAGAATASAAGGILGTGFTLADIGTAASLAGTGISAIGAIGQGGARSDAYAAEAENLRIQQQQAATAAAQSEAARRRQLTANLSTAEAYMAGRGVALGSGTPMAILTNAEGLGEQDIATDRLNWLTRADTFARQAGQADIASSEALTAGYLGGAASLLSGVGNLYAKTSGGKARV